MPSMVTPVVTEIRKPSDHVGPDNFVADLLRPAISPSAIKES